MNKKSLNIILENVNSFNVIFLQNPIKQKKTHQLKSTFKLEHKNI